MPQYSDDLIKSILRSTKTIAMVGASGNEMRPSYFAMKYLLDKGFVIHPINPGMAGKKILGQTVYHSLKDVPAPVDMVDIFRTADVAPAIVHEAIQEKDRLGIKTIWMQLGIISHEAEEKARAAGLNVIMDRCPKIEYGRHSGEIGWMGVNRRVIDNRKPLFVQQGRFIEARHVMLKIWGRANSINVQKAMWAVGESGVAHQRIDAGGPFGGLQTAEFRAMNPNTRVPVIDDDGVIVWESHSIVRYISAKYGKGTLWAEDAAERAKADMWIDWTLADLQAAFMGAFAGYWRTPESQRNMNMVRNAWARTNTLLQLLDAHLAGKQFITGDAFTMGDIPAGTQLFRYYEMQIPLDRPKLPNVEGWYARLKDRPAYREHVMVSFQDLKGR